MDWTTLALSTLAVFGLMFASGFCISLLSSLMQCGKTGLSTSAVQGLIWAVGPSLIYAVAATVQVVRDPFKIYDSSIYAVGFLMMMVVWPMTVYNINNTERAICVPSTSEMTAFKTKLLAELKQKQAANEKKE